jgi:hypothetical protein
MSHFFRARPQASAPPASATSSSSRQALHEAIPPVLSPRTDSSRFSPQESEAGSQRFSPQESEAGSQRFSPQESEADSQRFSPRVSEADSQQFSPRVSEADSQQFSPRAATTRLYHVRGGRIDSRSNRQAVETDTRSNRQAVESDSRSNRQAVESDSRSHVQVQDDPMILSKTEPMVEEQRVTVIYREVPLEGINHDGSLWMPHTNLWTKYGCCEKYYKWVGLANSDYPYIQDNQTLRQIEGHDGCFLLCDRVLALSFVDPFTGRRHYTYE